MLIDRIVGLLIWGEWRGDKVNVFSINIYFATKNSVTILIWLI